MSQSGSGAFCVGCGADGATMQCPKCKELGLGVSLFCNQTCFKANWGKHKAKHSEKPSCSIRTMTEMEVEKFKFTGPLRPGLTTPKRFVPKTILKPDYADHPEGFPASEEIVMNSNKITKWTGQDLDKIKRVAKLSREVLDVCGKAVKPGITTDDLDAIGHDACVSRGMYPSPLNYRQFPKSLCTSVNEVICHGIPDSYVLQEGDIVNLDISCYLDGYHGDLNETVFVGKPQDDATVKLVHTAYLCMMAGIECVKVGELYKHIGDVITPIAEANGYGVTRSVCGHGIGKLFHTAPNVPHYANNRQPGVMAEGNVFTIEPMINEGSWHDKLWPDNWTLVTRDGKRSAQFEHTMVCTKKGAEILTPYEDGVPFYQKQLAEWGIPLPEITKPGEDATKAILKKKSAGEEEDEMDAEMAKALQ